MIHSVNHHLDARTELRHRYPGIQMDRITCAAVDLNVSVGSEILMFISFDVSNVVRANCIRLGLNEMGIFLL